MPSEAWDEVGSHGRFFPKPDGLDRKCPVCKAGKGDPCRNPLTSEPRRGGVSCIGRVERSTPPLSTRDPRKA